MSEQNSERDEHRHEKLRLVAEIGAFGLVAGSGVGYAWWKRHQRGELPVFDADKVDTIERQAEILLDKRYVTYKDGAALKAAAGLLLYPDQPASRVRLHELTGLPEHYLKNGLALLRDYALVSQEQRRSRRDRQPDLYLPGEALLYAADKPETYGALAQELDMIANNLRLRDAEQ